MSYPQIEIAPSAAKRAQHHDCWVFRDELMKPSSATNGEIVELIDSDGTFLAYAFYSTVSHIAARIISTKRERLIDEKLLRFRIHAAIAKRDGITGTDARRLIFSEADGLPGLIVDQYAEHLVLQIRTAGMERFKPAIVDMLQSALKPRGILERSDKEFRDEEGLPPVKQVLAGIVPERVQIVEDDLQFLVDPHDGQKTGFYLDQRDTRRAFRTFVKPGERVLDVCAYTGAFGIGAASRGAQVLCVEQQESCIALGREHAALNRVQDQIEWVTADAFYWLEAKANTPDRFDWVLLDPPGLVKSKTDIQKGRQALHRLLVHALRLLTARGTLLLSVCSYHLLGLTEEILRIAAAEHRTRLRIRGITMQASDHPWILQAPMTRYLMSWMAQRDE